MRVVSPLLVSPLPLRLFCQFVCKYRAGIAADHEHVRHLPQKGLPWLAVLEAYIPMSLRSCPCGQRNVFCLSLGLTQPQSTCDTEDPELSHLPPALCRLE